MIRTKEEDDKLHKMFPEEMDMVATGRCPFCKEPILKSDFKDTLSLKEFSISGICQSCQDLSR